MEGPKNGGFMRENPIKMDDLGVSPFWETSMSRGCWQGFRPIEIPLTPQLQL